jgi:hypothetical protein
MGQPFPPAGNQSSHTERPLKVYAEQYLAGQPLPVGVSTTVFPPAYPNGEPRVYATTGTYAIQDTDWVISNRYTGQPIEVISDEEFGERFGGGGGPPLAEGG